MKALWVLVLASLLDARLALGEIKFRDTPLWYGPFGAGIRTDIPDFTLRDYADKNPTQRVSGIRVWEENGKITCLEMFYNQIGRNASYHGFQHGDPTPVFQLSEGESIMGVNISFSWSSFDSVQFITNFGRSSDVFGTIHPPVLTVDFLFPLRFVTGLSSNHFITSLEFHIRSSANYCDSYPDPPRNAFTLYHKPPPISIGTLYIDNCRPGYRFPNKELVSSRKCVYLDVDKGQWSTGSGDCEAFCGDGMKVDEEQCEGNIFGDLSNISCAAEGKVSCNDNCTLDLSKCHKCGDGRITTGEDCEPELMEENGGNALQCSSFGFYENNGVVGCTNDCTFNFSLCEYCGDGKATHGEECDRDSLANTSCESHNPSYHSGTLECDANCEISTSQCEFCGDGKISEHFEQCDPSAKDVGGGSGTPLVATTNLSRGDLDSKNTFENGTILSCAADCRLVLGGPTAHSQKGGSVTSPVVVESSKDLVLWLLIGGAILSVFGIGCAIIYCRVRHSA